MIIARPVSGEKEGMLIMFPGSPVSLLRGVAASMPSSRFDDPAIRTPVVI
jgi:hypothetical protein